MALFTDLGGAVPTNAGYMFYRLKTLLLSAGWTVRGSGDGGTHYSNGTLCAAGGVSLPFTMPFGGGSTVLGLTSVTGLPTSGTLLLDTSLYSTQTSVTYSGISGSTATGCSGGSGVVATSTAAYVDVYTTGAIAATAKAWVRLMSPDNKYEILIQNASSSGDANWTMLVSGSHFTGTGNGAISATVAPTATDQQYIMNNYAIGLTDGAYRITIVAGDSSFGYGFVMYTNNTGVNNSNGCIVFDPVTASASDLFPVVSWAIFNSVYALGYDTTVMAALQRPNGWINYGGTGAVWQQLTAQHLYDNAASLFTFPPHGSTQGVGTDIASQATAILPVIWACCLANAKTGWMGWKGISKMLGMVGTWGFGHGQIIGPISGQYYCMVVSSASYPYYCIPWPNSTPPVP